MSHLQLDYTNCLASSIGATHGLNDSEMDTLIAKIPKHHENIAELAKNDESAFFSLPDQNLDDLQERVSQHQGKWEYLVVLGIGGATLGPRTLIGTLAHEQFNLIDAKHRKGPRVLFIDNADPRSIEDTMSVINPKKTLFQLITKTGTTVETLALYLWLQDYLKQQLGKNSVTKQFIVCTDMEKSPLAAIAAKHKTPLMNVPSNLGDRFNILAAPSLFIAGLCGISVSGLLAGARHMKERCWHGEASKNPAYMHSLIHYLLTRKRRKTIHATMGFSNRLATFVEWYDHLLAVSLGKMLNRKGKAVHVGPSPTSCIGPNGLHGQMQLYAEGPFDKVVTFITLNDHGASITIPTSPDESEPIDYIGGNKIEELIDIAYITAAQTITVAGRPNMTIQLDNISPESIGALVYMLQLSTVMSAELYGIDAFDQPGVDANKQGLYAQLGRAGFEDKAKIMQNYRDRETKVC